MDGGLAEHLLELPGGAQRVLGGPLAGHHLHQAVLRRMVEVVQPQEAIRPSGHLCQLAHREGRRVGGQDGLLRTGLVQPAEHILLYFQVFEHRLHHQVTVGQPCEISAALDPAADGFRLLWFEQLALHALGQGVGDALHAPVHLRLVHVHQDHRVAFGGHLLCDAAAHVPGTHHAQAVQGGTVALCFAFAAHFALLNWLRYPGGLTGRFIIMVAAPRSRAAPGAPSGGCRSSLIPRGGLGTLRA